MSNKNIIIGVLVLIIIIVIIVYFYKKGKSNVTRANPPVDNGNPNSTTTNNNPVGLSNATIKFIVDTAFQDYNSTLKGILGTHDETLYQPIAQMSDTDFVKAYDIWNNEYQAKDGNTMVQAIESLYGHWSGGGILDVQNVIAQKASRLNLV